MPEIPRPWTAQILKDGMTLYAWMAMNQRHGMFATENVEHCRRFDTSEDAESWIERLKVPNAVPYNLNNPSASAAKDPKKKKQGAKVKVATG